MLKHLMKETPTRWLENQPQMLTRLDGRVLKLVSPKTETNYNIRHFNVVDIQMLILLTLHLVSSVKVNSE